MVLQLKERLWAYVVENNPDLMLSLKGSYSVAQYLDEKVKAIMPTTEQLLSDGCPVHSIEEICMEEMTRDLKPSRFNYIRSILQRKFQPEYDRLREKGVLTYETINLIEHCQADLTRLDFNLETMNSSELMQTIEQRISIYFYSNAQGHGK